MSLNLIHHQSFCQAIHVQPAVFDAIETGQAIIASLDNVTRYISGVKPGFRGTAAFLGGL